MSDPARTRGRHGRTSDPADPRGRHRRTPDPGAIERRYRRLLAWYPRPFRQKHEDELLSVLIAGADDGRWHAGLAESMDLIRGALWMRLRAGGPRPARTVQAAIRLMYVGAVVELGTLITIAATLGSLKAAILHRNPGYSAAQWHAELHGHIVPLEVSAAIAIGLWLWMAWANRRGRGWARVAFAAFFALTTSSLAHGIAQHAATYDPADLIAGVLVWLVTLATVVLIFCKGSNPHYHWRPPAR